MFSSDFSVGFRRNTSPSKFVETLLQTFGSNWFVLQVPLSIISILFLYLLLFPHDYYHAWAWFPVLFQYIVELLGPRVRVVGFSRFHLSNDFILVTPIGNLHVTLKRHYYEEAHHFPHKVCIIFLSLLMYTPTIADQHFFHNYLKNQPY